MLMTSQCCLHGSHPGLFVTSPPDAAPSALCRHREVQSLLEQNFQVEMDKSISLMTLLLQNRGQVWRKEAVLESVLDTCDQLLATRDQLQVLRSEILGLRDFEPR